MSVTKLAQVIGKVVKVKSPMGKLGMAAVAGGTVASIFSGCKKEEVTQTIHLDDSGEPLPFPPADSTLLDSLLHYIQHQLDTVPKP